MDATGLTGPFLVRYFSMEVPDKITKVGDLFQLIESMEFFAGDVALNKSEPYLAIKEHFSGHMNDRIPREENISSQSSSGSNASNAEPPFQKRDLNEAEEY